MLIPIIQSPKRSDPEELSKLAKYGIAYIPISEEVIRKLEFIEATAKIYFKQSKDQKNQYPLTPETREGFLDQATQGYDIERYIVRTSPIDPTWKICSVEMLEVKNYFQHEIMQPLLLALFEHLKIDPGKIRIYFEAADSTLSIIYYPECNVSSAQKRIQPHKDAAFMTILWSQRPGLEVKINDKWHGNLIKQGYIILHLGNGLKLMTDGRCHAITHRVQIPNANFRLSIASFYTQDPELGFFNAVTGKQIANTFAEYLASCLAETYPLKDTG